MSRISKIYFLLAVVILAFGINGLAQSPEPQQQLVGAELKASPMLISPGGRLTLNVKLQLQVGAHANSNTPDDPLLIPTVFIPGKTDGVTWGPAKYPEPTKVVETYSVNPLSVFEDGAEITVPATIASTLTAKQLTLSAALRIQVCDHQQCYPPRKLPLSIQVQVRNDGSGSVVTGKADASPAPVSDPVDFDFVDFTGKPRKISEFRGKFVLIDFWATWCKPCLADIPKLKELYQKHKDAGFEIVGMDAETLTDDDEAPDPDFAKQQAEQAKKIVATRGVTWAQATAETAVPIAKKVFAVRALPTKILLDGDGKVVARIGENDDLIGTVEKVLQGKK